MNIEIQVGEPAFQFPTYTTWVNKATSWFKNANLGTGNSICVDSQGRLCPTGKQMMRARDENTFPVTVYPMVIP